MEINLERAIKIKALLEKASLNNIIIHAQKSFPAESCGFLLQGGIVHPAHNVVETLYDSTLTSKNAFLIDNETWKTVSNSGKKIVGIYHSHTHGSADMSSADKKLLKWADMYYVVVGLVDHNPAAAKLFWWSNGELQSLELNMAKGG